MGKSGLTAKEVLNIKPTDNRQEIPAGPPTGLYLVVHRTGRKGWAFRYRYKRRTRNITFEKQYPDQSLAAARAEAQSYVDELEAGRDPAEMQAAEIQQSTPSPLKSVTDEWLKRHVDANLRDRTKAEFRRIIDIEILPAWKHKTIKQLGRPDVLRLLDSIVDRDAPILANKVLAVLKSFFSWAIERGYVDLSPASDIRPPSKANSRKRVLEPSELTEVWNATESLGYPAREFTRFLILSAQRRGEVATMRWKDLDLEKAIWSLPAEATKADRVHDVPLSTAAVKLLKALPTFKKGDYVFTTTSGAKAINGFSKMKERVDTATMNARKKAGIKKNISEWTFHDLRRSASTHMAKAGIPPHVLSAILNHSPGSTMGVTSIYNRFRYTEERRAALQAWAEFVLNLTTPTHKAASA